MANEEEANPVRNAQVAKPPLVEDGCSYSMMYAFSNLPQIG